MQVFTEKVSQILLLIVILFMIFPAPAKSSVSENARTDSYYWLVKAMEFSERGDFKRARACVDISLMLDPGNFQSKNFLQELESRELEAVKTIPKSPPAPQRPSVPVKATTSPAPRTGKSVAVTPVKSAKSAYDWYREAVRYLKTNQLEKAKKCAEIALEMDENNFEVKSLLQKINRKIVLETVPVIRKIPTSIPEPEPEASVRYITPPTEQEKTVTVTRGDTLCKIARKYYGDASFYKELARYNNLANPDKLEVGQKLILPPKLKAYPESTPVIVPPVGKEEKRVVSGYKKYLERLKPGTETIETTLASKVKLIPTPPPPAAKEPVKQQPVKVATRLPEKKSGAEPVSWLNRVARTAKEHYLKSQALWKAGRLEEAMEEYKKAVNENPKYLERPNEDLIEQATAKLKEEMRGDPSILSTMHYKLGSIYQKKGELKEAMHEYQRAIDFNPDFAEAYFNLGLIYEKLDEVDMAIATYEKINEMFASSPTMVNLATDRIIKLVEMRHFYGGK